MMRDYPLSISAADLPANVLEGMSSCLDLNTKGSLSPILSLPLSLCLFVKTGTKQQQGQFSF